MTNLEEIAAAREAGDIDRLVQAIPYARFLGLQAAPAGESIAVTMKYAPHLVGNPAVPALHGGTLGALLEAAAIFELVWSSETIVLPRTISITVDFLRSAALVDTFARAQVTRLGRRVAFVRAEAWQEDAANPVAAARANFLIKR